VLILQGVGTGLLLIGAWLGGTLVSRNQIGVDHRYANAGKWSEARLKSLGASALVVARPDELQVDQMKLLHVDGRRIVLARIESGYAAFDDHCTHRGGSLADGALMCGVVQCPWHGSQFDVHTGDVKCGPAKEPIETYPIATAHRTA
jgi:nitrite reductase/ring-hydroxylating ferredoxin subunit